MTVWPATIEDFAACCAGCHPDDGKGFFTGRGSLWQHPGKTRWYGKTTFDFQIDSQDPLTWHFIGIHAQPDRHFETDLGSIPRMVQVIPALSKDRYMRSYVFHDCCYLYGGWYVRQTGGGYGFVRVSRAEADEWLYKMMLAEGATVATAKVVWSAVRMFGGFSWNADKQRQAREESGIVI